LLNNPFWLEARGSRLKGTICGSIEHVVFASSLQPRANTEFFSTLLSGSLVGRELISSRHFLATPRIPRGAPGSVAGLSSFVFIGTSD